MYQMNTANRNRIVPADMLVAKLNDAKLTFYDSDGTEVLRITHEEIRYNRDAFPNDTYTTAAHRMFKIIAGSFPSYRQNNLIIHIRETDEYPRREITLSRTNGFVHDINIDTWHWWFIENLSKLMTHD